jgi:hypothetical protein
MIRRAEELQMLYTLFRRTLAAQAQNEALRQVANEANEPEQQAEIEKQQAIMTARLDAIGTITRRMIGGYSEEELVNAIDKLTTLMDAHTQGRREQARIRLEIELAGMRGMLSNEQRLQAEQALNHTQEQLSKIASEVDALFPKPSLIVTA